MNEILSKKIKDRWKQLLDDGIGFNSINSYNNDLIKILGDTQLVSLEISIKGDFDNPNIVISNSTFKDAIQYIADYEASEFKAIINITEKTIFKFTKMQEFLTVIHSKTNYSYHYNLKEVFKESIFEALAKLYFLELDEFKSVSPIHIPTN